MRPCYYNGLPIKWQRFFAIFYFLKDIFLQEHHRKGQKGPFCSLRAKIGVPFLPILTIPGGEPPPVAQAIPFLGVRISANYSLASWRAVKKKYVIARRGEAPTHPRVASLAPLGQFTFWQSPSTFRKFGGDCHVASLLAMTTSIDAAPPDCNLVIPYAERMLATGRAVFTRVTLRTV